MAYKIDKNGMLKGDGLPDGVTINLEQYQQAVESLKPKQDSSLMYPTMQNQRTAADYASEFKVENGKTYAFIPQLEKYQPQGAAGYASGVKDSMVQAYGTGALGLKGPALGSWVEAQGIVLDDNTATGDTSGSFTFRNEGGGPLAVFGADKGFKRLATQFGKQADELLLGNKSGTTVGDIRQNAQRRTLY